MVIPSIVLASNTPGEDQEPFEDVAYDAEEEEDSGPESEEEEDSGPDAEEEEDSGPEAERARMGRDLSDKEDDTEYVLRLKKEVREKLSEFDEAKAARDNHDDMHTQYQDEEEEEFVDDSGHEPDEESRISMLMDMDEDLDRKKEEISELKGMIQREAENKRKRDLEDEGDNSRRGGPSAGTTGGSSEGGPSGGGSSGGVEGSSRVRTESPLDFVIDKERTELPPFDDLE